MKEKKFAVYSSQKFKVDFPCDNGVISHSCVCIVWHGFAKDKVEALFKGYNHLNRFRKTENTAKVELFAWEIKNEQYAYITGNS